MGKCNFLVFYSSLLQQGDPSLENECDRLSLVKGLAPGTDVMIKKIFLPKHLAKILLKLLLVFEKN
jgi:hypothetical protein